MTHTNKFINEFGSVYSNKIQILTESLKSLFPDLLNFNFDNTPSVYKIETTQARYSILLKVEPRNGPQSFKFIFIGDPQSKKISVWLNKYDSLGRGIDKKQRLFTGYMDEFRELDLVEVITPHLTPPPTN